MRKNFLLRRKNIAEFYKFISISYKKRNYNLLNIILYIAIIFFIALWIFLWKYFFYQFKDNKQYSFLVILSSLLAAIILFQIYLQGA